MEGPTQVFECILERVRPCLGRGSGVVVGVNGLDCAGKTRFADGCAIALRDSGLHLNLLHIDDCNHRRVQQASYEAFEVGACDDALVRRFYEASIDYDLAQKQIVRQAEGVDVLLVEGVFLYKPELAALFDVKIYLHVSPDVGRSRYASRRVAEDDPRPLAVFDELWWPAHLRYVTAVDPAATADIVIDNDDWSRPKLVL